MDTMIEDDETRQALSSINGMSPFEKLTFLLYACLKYDVSLRHGKSLQVKSKA